MAKKDRNKKNADASAPTSTEKWIEAMKQKYPESTDNFVNMLRHWGYQTVGHAFGIITESFSRCIEFYLCKYNQTMSIADARNLELLKSSLERAFQNSESFGSDLSYKMAA